MLSLRALTQPRVVGRCVAVAGALVVIAAWHDYATRPAPAIAPTIDVDPAAVAQSSAPDSWSVHLTSSEDAAPAPPVEPLVLRLARVDDDWDYRVFAADARFPVIFDDGTIAALFQDSEDFSGAPVTTLVAWSPSGARVAEFALGGNSPTANPKHVLGAANAWLADKSWHSLSGEASIVRSDDDALQRITPAAGAALVYDWEAGRLTRTGRAIRASFPSPGTSEFGACGAITGIQRAFGSEHLLVLVPSMNLGGDSCFGSRTADVAIAVALR